ncbi:hypothetical protein ABT214_24380, partial [Micromonospora purpureochromogenes]
LVRGLREPGVYIVFAGLTADAVPADTPTAAASTSGVPATRAAAGAPEVSAQRPEPGTWVA